MEKYQLTVGNAIARTVDLFPEKKAFVFEHRILTYREVNSRINKLANGLFALGYKKGDKLAALLYNGIEIAEISAACAKTGIIFVPISFRFVTREVEDVVGDSDATGIIFGAEFLNIAKSLRKNVPAVKDYFIVGEDAVDWAENYENFLQKHSDAEPKVEILETDTWYFGYTSGTTGAPKGAIVSHRCRTLLTMNIGIEFNLNEEDVQLLVMPMFHSNGLFFATCMGLGVGATVIIMRTFNPEEFLKNIQEYRVTYISMVPTMLNMILDLPDDVKGKYDVSSIRVVMSSSSPLLTSTKERTLAFFNNSGLNEFYGSSEAGMVTNLRLKDQARKVRSVGRPIPGVRIKLLDPEGKEVPVGQMGELYSFGPSADGYYKLPQADEQAFRDGWFSAGDVARQDEEGYFYIMDRTKDMISSGGENIFPIEIEEVLFKNSKIVKDCAVIGIRDETWGERVHALVILQPGVEISAEKLIAYCRSNLAGYKVPRSIEFVTELPKNQLGKTLKRVIRDRYWKADIKV